MKAKWRGENICKGWVWPYVLWKKMYFYVMLGGSYTKHAEIDEQIIICLVTYLAGRSIARFDSDKTRIRWQYF